MIPKLISKKMNTKVFYRSVGYILRLCEIIEKVCDICARNVCFRDNASVLNEIMYAAF